MNRPAGYDSAGLLGSPTLSGGSLSLRQLSSRTKERLLWAGLSLSLLLWALHSSTRSSASSQAPSSAALSSFDPKGRPKPKLLVSDAPTRTYARNLVKDKTYFTAFHYGGFTNQLIEHIKLVYFSKLVGRVAIIPDFFPSHGEGTEPPFSTFFDLPLWSSLSNVSILEWKDIKQPSVPKVEPSPETLACWGEPGEWGLTEFLKPYAIETSFWPINPIYDEPARTFDGLKLMLAQDQSDWLAGQKPEGKHLSATPLYPDTQLACLGSTFGAHSLVFDSKGRPRQDLFSFENLHADDPLWTQVGQYLRFTPQVEREVDRLIASLLPGKGPKPEFVGIHFRQGDFVEYDRITHDLVDQFEDKLRRVQVRLNHQTGRQGREPLPVIVATDSDKPSFKERLRKLGWITIDHDAFKTKDRLGGWWPGLLDSAVLSRAQALVGTDLSTFSFIAARRVESWQGGPTEIVDNLKG